jgi:HEAT repeat protein
VTEVYLKYLEHENPDTPFAALVCLGPITKNRSNVDVYRKCLKDTDPRVRELALKRLADEASESAVEPFRTEIEALLNDPDMKTKKAALKILKKQKE